MTTETMTRYEAAEAVLLAGPKDMTIGRRGRYANGYMATCYWPNGDVVRDVGCHGYGDTLAEAIADMNAKIEEAKAKGKPLKTAAECKEAVINLIREHEAAPASFRDAVDALPVAP